MNSVDDPRPKNTHYHMRTKEQRSSPVLSAYMDNFLGDLLDSHSLKSQICIDQFLINTYFLGFWSIFLELFMFLRGSEMTSIQNYDRIASHMARSILIEEGYLVEKTTGKNTIFHLIAWKEPNDIRFIRIRRSRRPEILQFKADIQLLVDLVKRHKIPGVVEFWILSNGQWKLYEILRGGAILKK